MLCMLCNRRRWSRCSSGNRLQSSRERHEQRRLGVASQNDHAWEKHEIAYNSLIPKIGSRAAGAGGGGGGGGGQGGQLPPQLFV